MSYDKASMAWLAGLIEGEGSFYFGDTPTIEIQMTDEDVIQRAAALANVHVRAPYRCKKGNRKLVYSFCVCGTKAIALMMTLYSFMGSRRREKMREVIRKWGQMRNTPRAPRGERFMAICHPDRVRSAHGLCHACYMRRYRERLKASA